MALAQEEVEFLIDALADYDVVCTHEQAQLLLRHIDLVIEKNQHLNLTRITNRHEALIKHCVDSLVLLPLLPYDRDDKDVSFVDMGTGGGFPGIPLGIMSCWQGLLVDSTQKKIKAVAEFIDQLGTDKLSAQAVRIEQLGMERRTSYDMVFARAVAELSVLLEYASPLLKKQGHFCALKAQPSEDEVQNAEFVAKLCGFTLVSRETINLPEDMGQRNLYLYMKTHANSVKLPRPIGVAKKSPLYLM